jgi:hypothetical protein
MRLLTALLAFLCLSASASADIIAVRFTNAKVASRYKDHLVPRNGEMMVVGEQFVDPNGPGGGVPGMGPAGGGRAPYNVMVADPNDPLNVSYKIEVDKDGKEKIVRNRKKMVTIPADDTQIALVIVKDGTLATFAADYAERKREVDALIAERDSKAKGSGEWMNTHQRALMNMERLESWLRSTLYPGAADKLAKDIAKQRKLATADAVRDRKNEALASVVVGAPTNDLVEAAKAISGGSDVFKVQESKHARIIYRETIDDARIKNLLILAEEIIDGFRVEFVDPYLDSAYEDHIPDHIFSEWFLGYDDVTKHERYFVDYYRQNWGARKDERLKMNGQPFLRNIAPFFVHYWRTDENTNFEGMIAHDLGHDLASCHFDKRRGSISQDWIGEGMGLFVSLEWLGSNSVVCKAFAEPVAGRSSSKRPADVKEGEKTVQLGLRDYYNALALELGVKIDKLALKQTADFDDADLAKSWSMIDYFAKKGGKQGELFLRAACTAARAPSTFINDWRAKGEEIFELEGVDVFAHFEAAWRAYAEIGQETGDARRK